MTATTQVSIYHVDTAGGTGDQVGEGSLIDPLLVLVHPPLSEQLASDSGSGTRLRVGICPPHREVGGAEVIDVAGVQVAALGSTEPPLVALDLVRAATSPSEQLLPTRAQAAGSNVEAAALAQAAHAHLIRHSPGHDVPGAPWCSLFPNAWFCN